MPAIFAVSVNVGNFRITGLPKLPGSVNSPGVRLTSMPNLSLPVKSRNISDQAALTVLWPET